MIGRKSGQAFGWAGEQAGYHVTVLAVVVDSEELWALGIGQVFEEDHQGQTKGPGSSEGPWWALEQMWGEDGL